MKYLHSIIIAICAAVMSVMTLRTEHFPINVLVVALLVFATGITLIINHGRKQP